MSSYHRMRRSPYVLGQTPRRNQPEMVDDGLYGRDFLSAELLNLPGIVRILLTKENLGILSQL